MDVRSSKNEMPKEGRPSLPRLNENKAERFRSFQGGSVFKPRPIN